VVPVRHAGEPVGEIAVAKAPGDSLRPTEEALLRDLASQAGLALHNVQLTLELQARLEEISQQAEDLRASQQRIVTAADDERRLLELTIADRVERRLEELEGDLGMIAPLVTEAPQEAAERLDAVGAEAQRTLEELREIARGIYPPLLADRGLRVALESLARRAGAEAVMDEVGRYAPEVEAAAYFCCLEALRSATGRVRFEVRGEDEALRFDIVPEAALPADTMTRIRDRVEALEGRLSERLKEDLRFEAVIPARALART
jgi:signal transduction histidine kinase